MEFDLNPSHTLGGEGSGEVSGRTSLVSFAVRLPKEGRPGREMLGSEGAVTPDEADDAAVAAAAYA